MPHPVYFRFLYVVWLKNQPHRPFQDICTFSYWLGSLPAFATWQCGSKRGEVCYRRLPC